LSKSSNQSSPASKAAPFGTSRVSGGIGSVTGLEQPPLRLFDTYQNAFYRVVEVCLMQMNDNSDSLNGNLQQVLPLLSFFFTFL